MAAARETATKWRGRGGDSGWCGHSRATEVGGAALHGDHADARVLDRRSAVRLRAAVRVAAAWSVRERGRSDPPCGRLAVGLACGALWVRARARAHAWCGTLMHSRGLSGLNLDSTVIMAMLVPWYVSRSFWPTSIDSSNVSITTGRPGERAHERGKVILFAALRVTPSTTRDFCAVLGRAGGTHRT